MNTSGGLYYRREDYAGFWLRLLIDVIDMSVFGVACVALFLAVEATFPPSKTVNDLMLAACAILAFFYFVILKRSRFGTFGYRVGAVRIVGLDGRPAGWMALTYRLGFGLLGPLNQVMDLVWLSGDTHRQALRDKFAQTYVVKRRAQPAGTGRIVYRNYDICGWNFLFREVKVIPALSVPVTDSRAPKIEMESGPLTTPPNEPGATSR